jgi:hypothetical protein
MNETKQEKTNVVRERMKWLYNNDVSVKLDTETFTGQYIDTLPLGKAYMFVFNCNGKARMVNTEKVIEIKQL